DRERRKGPASSSTRQWPSTSCHSSPQDGTAARQVQNRSETQVKLAGPALERTYGQDRKILPIRRDAILEIPSSLLRADPSLGAVGINHQLASANGSVIPVVDGVAGPVGVGRGRC